MSLETRRRLAAVKALLARAEAVCDEPAPFWWEGINRLHDVAEMFLCAICDTYAIAPPAKGFMDYWSAISAKTGTRIDYGPAMRRVNDLRISFKHHGTVPNRDELLKARNTVHDLIHDETPKYFEHLTLNSLNLADLIIDTEVKRLVDSALERWSGEEPDSGRWAMGFLKEALIQITSRGPILGKRGAFDLVESAQGLIRQRVRMGDHRVSDVLLDGLEMTQERMEGSLSNVNRIAVLAGLGVDLVRYMRLIQIPLRLSTTTSGRDRLMITQGAPTHFSQREFDENLDLVVSTSLLLESASDQITAHPIGSFSQPPP